MSGSCKPFLAHILAMSLNVVSLISWNQICGEKPLCCGEKQGLALRRKAAMLRRKAMVFRRNAAMLNRKAMNWRCAKGSGAEAKAMIGVAKMQRFNYLDVIRSRLEPFGMCFCRSDEVCATRCGVISFSEEEHSVV